MVIDAVSLGMNEFWVVNGTGKYKKTMSQFVCPGIWVKHRVIIQDFRCSVGP